MKKYIWIPVLLVLAAVMVIYTIPKSIVREYDGFIYGYEDKSIEGHVKVLLDGKLYPSIFGDDYFYGKIKINNEEYNVSSLLPGNFKMRLRGIKDKLDRRYILTWKSDIENGYTRTEANFNFTRDFKYIMGYTGKLRQEYNSPKVVIVGSAANRQEAESILKDSKIWGH